MQIYLPIAGMPVDVFSLLLVGMLTGILSGMFGVGGGFLTTPFLIFMGIPPAVAVSSTANQIIAASFSGFMGHVRRQNVDFHMGTLLLIGGVLGSSAGVWFFVTLKKWGQIDLVISLVYVFFLGSIGILMALESIKTIIRKKKGKFSSTPLNPPWLQNLPLPFPTYFARSKIRISALLPIGLGLFVGMLVSIMGIGGGFVMVPAMVYLFRMPTAVVIGTSLFQIIFITANVTLLHAMNTQTVDIILALIMLTGSVVGAQMGTRLSVQLPAEQLRAYLSLLVLAVVLKLAFGLFIRPSDMYEIVEIYQH